MDNREKSFYGSIRSMNINAHVNKAIAMMPKQKDKTADQPKNTKGSVR